MRNLRAQMEVARVGLLERGEAPLAPLPAVCDDATASPAVRLRAAMDHVASLLPEGGGHRMIWGFLPMRIDDRIVGVIIVYSVLPQKEHFVSVDFELFKMLGAHAASALVGAMLYAAGDARLPDATKLSSMPKNPLPSSASRST